jgi:large subunit ribosomal protein L9
MEVILTADVEHLGNMGEVVKVRDGYGRNYLIPNRLAVQATAGNRKQFTHVRREVERQSAKLREKALGMFGGLDGASVTLAQRTGGEDKLYGSVGKRDIVEALAEAGHAVERRQLLLERPLK